MAQELAEVNVEHVSAGPEHDVVIVAIADPQDVCGHAAACTRVDEVLYRLTGFKSEVRVQSLGSGFRVWNQSLSWGL